MPRQPPGISDTYTQTSKEFYSTAAMTYGDISNSVSDLEIHNKIKEIVKDYV